jgi:hypothetical protein
MVPQAGEVAVETVKMLGAGLLYLAVLWVVARVFDRFDLPHG